MKLTPILAGERIARASTTSRGVVRRPAEQDGVQLDDEDGSFFSAFQLEEALVELRARQEQRMVAKKRLEAKERTR